MGPAARELLGGARWGNFRPGGVRPGGMRPVGAGAVHSVFRRVFNVRLGSGRLVAFATADVPVAPATVVTELEAGGGWPALGVQAGDPVRLDEGGVHLPGRELSIEVAGATPYVPRIERPVEVGLDRIGPALERAAELALRASEGPPARGGLRDLLPLVPALFEPGHEALRLPDPFCQAAFGHMAELVRGVRRGEAGSVRRGARGLAGLGPGLTPSGDDALAGLMVALALAGRALGTARVALEEINPVILAEAAGATGELSGEMLRYAALGQASEPVEEAAAAVLAGEEAQLGAAVARLCATGASSGVDHLWGILVGIRLGLERAGQPVP